MATYKNPLFPDETEIEIDNTIVLSAKRFTIRMAIIEWSDIRDWFESSDTVVTLEKSHSPKGPFEAIATININSPNFFLDENSMMTQYRTEVMYYRLVCTDIGKMSKTISSEKIANNYGSEILNRHLILLKEGHSGNLMYLFIKKRLGERCPDCWDTIRGIRTKSNCKTCMNTGYLNGYYNPIGIYISVSPEQAIIEQPVTGTQIEGRIQGWTAGYPRINLGDIIVDPGTQDIWGVSQINVTTHKRVITKQELVLDRHNEDTAILQLLQKIPKIPEQEDIRHGEILF